MGIRSIIRRPRARVMNTARMFGAAPLVNGQNYYTAITRARYGIKLWTEDPDRLVEKLERFSGEKTSALEGLGRLDRDSRPSLARRHGLTLDRLRLEQERARAEHRDQALEQGQLFRSADRNLGRRLAGQARSIAELLDRVLSQALDRATAPAPPGAAARPATPQRESGHEQSHDPQRQSGR